MRTRPRLNAYKRATELLTTALSGWLIERFAEELDVVERERRVDIVILVWTLVLGFPAGAKRTLASLRRRFEQAMGETISRAAFHDRLTPRKSPRHIG